LKGHLLVFGYSSVLNPLTLGTATVHWAKCVKYLGVQSCFGQKVKFGC